MPTLVLLRHGESVWNKENRFTGWTDVDLSERGREEARDAGRLLKDGGYAFDLAYTSVLKRAIRTLWIALDELDQMWLPVIKQLAAERAALRRAAGAEQGGDGGEARRSAGQDLAPQLRHPAAAADRPTIRAPPAAIRATPASMRGEVPLTESLKDTVDALPARTGTRRSRPSIQSGKRVLIAAHGNSLRALVKYLDGISDEDDRRAQHPDRHPAGLRARRAAEAAASLLPRRCQGRRGGRRARRAAEQRPQIRKRPFDGEGPFRFVPRASGCVIRLLFPAFRPRQSAASGGSGDRWR